MIKYQLHYTYILRNSEYLCLAFLFERVKYILYTVYYTFNFLFRADAYNPPYFIHDYRDMNLELSSL